MRADLDDAIALVRSERESIAAKVTAFDRFVDRVETLSTEPTQSSAESVPATGTLSADVHSTADGCQTVRRAFAETVRPHSVEDVDDPESLDATIRAELSDSIAVALAPTSKTSFSPKLKQAVVSAASARRSETDVVRRALETEAAQLDDADAVVDDVTTWIVTEDETPLGDLGFDALRNRHETLAAHRDRCDELARRRQEFLQGVTNRDGTVTIRHRRLIPYVYRDLSADHPVLARVAELDRTCAECQRVVRRHLVRRG